MVRSREDIIAVLRAMKPDLVRRFGVRDLPLFGSFARGDQADRSDIEILVDVDPEIGLDFVTLDDMLEATERIARYVAGMAQPVFLADEKTSDAVVRDLEIPGEATAHVPDEFRTGTPELSTAGPARAGPRVPRTAAVSPRAPSRSRRRPR